MGTLPDGESGLVIYAVDSMIVYELLSNERIQMAGTSGSPVLNSKREVVSNSFGGFAVPNPEEIENIAGIFPLVRQLPSNWQNYGIGLPSKSSS